MIFTIHFIDKWELKSTVLKTTCFPYRHTGENIKMSFEEMVSEFRLENKRINVVTGTKKFQLNYVIELYVDYSNAIVLTFFRFWV